jgi:uncharacterized protein with FMN-binding domain
MSRRQSSQASGFAQSIKKFLLSAFVVVTFIAYFFHQKLTSQASANATASTGIPAATPSATQTAAGSAQSLYKNGTFNGPAVDAYYGLVQVQVIIQGGKIANVNFLQYPNDRRTSQEINSQAMPWLQQEAIQAQSAKVDLISGATLTSEGFTNSLQAALQSASN